MNINYKDYSIEIIDDFIYSLDSADNINSYTFEYCQGPTHIYKAYQGAKHGVRVNRKGEEIASAFLSKTGGYTHIHEHSFVLSDDTLFLCCSDEIYALSLPELKLNWHRKMDLAVCIAIYPFKNDFIVHGELFATRMDKEGNKKWEFNAYDIFVPQGDQPALEIVGEEIILRDFEGYEYRLNEDGVVLEQKRINDED